MLVAFEIAQKKKPMQMENAKEIKEYFSFFFSPTDDGLYAELFIFLFVNKKTQQNKTNKREKNYAARIDRKIKVYITLLNRQFSSCATKFSQNIFLLLLLLRLILQTQRTKEIKEREEKKKPKIQKRIVK